jgi:addiction module RelE/StbE family toxin
VTVRWSDDAVRHLEDILEFIGRDRPAVALSVVERLISLIDALDEHPLLGRRGLRRGTRERLIPGLPYVIVYRVLGASEVEIVGVFHGRRQFRD